MNRTRIIFAFILMRRIHHHQSQSLHYFAKRKVARSPIRPVLLAFLGLPFGKKSEAEEKSAPIVIMGDLKVQMEKADELFDDNKFKETVEFLKTCDTTNSEVQWRLGRALFKLSGEETSSTKNDTIREAYKQLHEALEKDDNNFAIHKWYAILLDAKSNLDGIKERVTQLENVKKHMVRAIELNPTDSTSRYILGEFAYGLADLPWYQRKLVSTIFATPPTATYEEALEHFLKAEELKKDFYSMNKLLIGKTYLAMKNNEKAKEYLTLASCVVVLNEDDRKCKEEAEKLLGKLK